MVKASGSSTPTPIRSPSSLLEWFGWRPRSRIRTRLSRSGTHFLGLQGHPEFTADYAAKLMEARRGSLIPDDVVEAGLASLVQSADTAAWKALTLDFLTETN